MPQDLKDRPGAQYDDEMGWYRPGADELEDAYNAPSATDDDLPGDHPSRSSISDSELAASEKSGGSDRASQDASEEEDSDFINNTGKKGGKRGFHVSRNQGIAGGIVALLIGGTIGALSIAQGPAKLIHFSQKLTGFHLTQDENHTDGRLGRLIRYARTQDTPERRNLGYLGNKLANHYEGVLKRAGMNPVYEGGRTGRFNSVDIDIRTDEGKKAFADMKARGVEVEILPLETHGPGKRRVNLSNVSAKQRRLAVNGIVDASGKGKISSAIAKRVLKLRGQVEFHPLKNVSRRADEKISDFVKRRMEQRNEGHQRGAPDAKLTVDSENEVDADGNEVSTEASDAADTLETDKPASGSTPDVNESTGKLRSKVGAGVGATAVLGLICGLYELGEQIPELQYQKVVIPLIRVGWEAISIGSQLMAGDNVEWDEIGAFSKQLYDSELGSAFSAASIQAEEGKEITGLDMPAEAKPGKEQPLLFRILSNVIESIPGAATTCGALTSTVGGWALTILGAAIGATGPVGFLASIATDLAQDLALGQAISGALRWYIGEPLDFFPVGSLMGNYANFGARLAANDSFISKGGTELSGSEDAALAADRKEQEMHRIQNSSIFARYFDISEPTSLAARTLFETEGIQQPTSNIANIASLFNPASLLNGLRLTQTVSATNAYDYGFPEYGFSLEEEESERLDDPYEIAERVEPNIAALNDEYGEDCFGVTVDESTGKLNYGNTTKRYDEIPDKCNNRGNQELADYRMYISDLTVAKSMACYEGLDDGSCEEMGFAVGSTNSPNNPAVPVTGGSGPIDESQTSEIPGAPGIRIATDVLPQFTSMMDAARAQGIELLPISSGWRDPQRQIQLRIQNCGGSDDYSVYEKPSSQCSPPTARPGTSNHEGGRAIDFGSMCYPNATCPGNARWEWLHANAADFGFYPLSSEAWHWSTTGN